MVPGGSKRGSVNLDLTCFFYYNFSPPVFGSAGGGGEGSSARA